MSGAIKALKRLESLNASRQRLSEISKKISRVEDGYTPSSSSAPKDWTSVYKKFSDWEDVEELQGKRVETEKKIESFNQPIDCLGHHYDHRKERLFYEQSEEAKMKECERYRLEGNFLFSEGFLEKSAEYYKIAVAYYEYCFPESDSQQAELDALRFACLCNAALCFTRLGQPRSAVASASLVINEWQKAGRHEVNRTGYAKALFRRGQALRYLDDYE